MDASHCIPHGQASATAKVCHAQATTLHNCAAACNRDVHRQAQPSICWCISSRCIRRVSSAGEKPPKTFACSYRPLQVQQVLTCLVHTHHRLGLTNSVLTTGGSLRPASVSSHPCQDAPTSAADFRRCKLHAGKQHLSYHRTISTLAASAGH